MAKYTIKHSCGHEEKHEFHGDAWIKVEASKKQRCRKCWKAQTERENAEWGNAQV